MTDKAIIESYLVRLEKLGAVRAKPMFGEWGVYLNESFAAIIGEGRLYLKVKGVPENIVDELFGNRNQPYDGAKNYAEAEATDFEDAEWVAAVRSALLAARVYKAEI